MMARFSSRSGPGGFRSLRGGDVLPLLLGDPA